MERTTASLGHGGRSCNGPCGGQHGELTDLAVGANSGHNDSIRPGPVLTLMGPGRLQPPPMPDIPTTSDPYAPWRFPDYRRYAVGWFMIMFAKQVETLAVSVYLVKVYDKFQSPLALGIMALVQALPVIVLAIAGGQLADRFDRRAVLLCTLTLGALASLGLLIVSCVGGSVAWILFLLGVGAVAQALGSPSRAALLPQLVSSKQFSRAVTWNSSVFYIALVTGPVAGGLLLTADGNLAPAFAVSFACRFVAGIATALIRHRQRDRRRQAVSWRSVMAGVRFVWRTKLILATITLDLFAVLLGGAVYLLPYYTEHILHVGSMGLGILRAADAFGAICMALLLAHRPPLRRAGAALLWAVAGFGAATIVFGLSQSFGLSILAMLFVGAFDNISVVVRHTLVQMLTPDEMRGRVSAVNGIFIVASNDLGGLESGLTAWLFGPVVSVVGGGIGTILVVLAALCAWPQLLKIGALDSIKPAEIAESDREV